MATNYANRKYRSGPQDIGFRNIIINGDMSIAQRGTSATGLGNGDGGYHTCDRWRFGEAGAPTFEFTMSQDTDVPTGQGFATSLKMDCTTAQGSLASGDSLLLQQLIEGQMLQYLKKGTANAESLILSFWVKSNKTGTYIANLYDGDNIRQISKSYTIDASNTWEKKTITFAGDTTGAFDNDNAVSLYLQLYLGAGTNWTSGTLPTSWESAVNADTAVGQVNLADSTANEFYITGVQLEAGTTASDFEFLPVDVNLARCQRYLYVILEGTLKYFADAAYYTSSALRFSVNPKVILRAQPTLVANITSNTVRIYRDGTYDPVSGPFSLAGGFGNFFMISTTTDVSGTAGQAGHMYSTNAGNYFYLDSEL